MVYIIRNSITSPPLFLNHQPPHYPSLDLSTGFTPDLGISRLALGGLLLLLPSAPKKGWQHPAIPVRQRGPPSSPEKHPAKPEGTTETRRGCWPPGKQRLCPARHTHKKR